MPNYDIDKIRKKKTTTAPNPSKGGKTQLAIVGKKGKLKFAATPKPKSKNS